MEPQVVIQALLSVVLLLLGMVLYGLRGDLKGVRMDLQALNNLVLAGYTTRNELEARVAAIREEFYKEREEVRKTLSMLSEKQHEHELILAVRGLLLKGAIPTMPVAAV